MTTISLTLRIAVPHHVQEILRVDHDSMNSTCSLTSARLTISWRHYVAPGYLGPTRPRRVADSVGSMLGEELWERHAKWWQERYTNGADPEYSEYVLPMVRQRLGTAHRVLDVGSGEGQVTRCIASLGADAVGIDPSASQVTAARKRGGATHYLRARAEHLPFLDATFDGIVVSMSLEHVEPFEPAVAEIARVLGPHGRLLLVLVHPLLQSPGSGWVEDAETGQHFWRVGAYLADEVALDEVEPGVSSNSPIGL